MQQTEDGDVLVGIDDFAQSLIGTVDEVKLPRLLKRVKQGNVLCYVKHNHRIVPLVSPVTGRIIQKNEMVLHNPLLVNASPYSDGWLVRIKPSALKPQLNNLLTGKVAQQWLEQAKAHLVRCFSTTPALMYQDGGILLGNLSDRCSDEEWKNVAKEFFLVEPNSHSGSKR
jgi:glycine cleavage system H protein